MSKEEFEDLYDIFDTAVEGNTFTYTGFMTAFGYGKPSPQVQIVNADEIVFDEITNAKILEIATSKIKVAGSVGAFTSKIDLPTKIDVSTGVNVTWTSNSNVIDVVSGTVAHAEALTNVILTATLSFNGETRTEEYSVLVAAKDNTVYETIATLDLEDAAAPTAQSYGNSPTKQGYKAATVNLGSPKANWLLDNVLIAATGSDKYDGTLSMRAKSGGRIEIQQDGEYNAVSFDAATYGNDATGMQITIEYSTDGGKTWKTCDQVVSVETRTLETYTFVLPKGTKRIAIVTIKDTGNRVNIDNVNLKK